MEPRVASGMTLHGSIAKVQVPKVEPWRRGMTFQSLLNLKLPTKRLGLEKNGIHFLVRVDTKKFFDYNKL